MLKRSPNTVNVTFLLITILCINFSLLTQLQGRSYAEQDSENTKIVNISNPSPLTECSIAVSNEQSIDDTWLLQIDNEKIDQRTYAQVLHILQMDGINVLEVKSTQTYTKTFVILELDRTLLSNEILDNVIHFLRFSSGVTANCLSVDIQGSEMPIPDSYEASGFGPPYEICEGAVTGTTCDSTPGGEYPVNGIPANIGAGITDENPSDYMPSHLPVGAAYLNSVPVGQCEGAVTGTTCDEISLVITAEGTPIIYLN